MKKREEGLRIGSIMPHVFFYHLGFLQKLATNSEICFSFPLQRWGGPPVSFPISSTHMLHTSLFFNMAPNTEKLPFKHLSHGIISHSHRPVQGDTFYMHSLGSF